MHQTGASMVVRKETWLYEVVYTLAGKPAADRDMYIALFVQSYMIIMKCEEGAINERMATDLEDLKSDTKLYSYGAWLNQLEQWRTVWDDEKVKLKFRWALVWNPGRFISLCHFHCQAIGEQQRAQATRRVQCPGQAWCKGL